MDDELSALTRLPWHWDWVPGPGVGEDVQESWVAHMVARFADWTARGLAAARASWPADADTEFPLTGETIGRGHAQWLRERADRLPSTARLAWGAAFLNGQPRWAPVPVVVDFRRPVDSDSAYLMDAVGAKGRDDDAREPTIDYVTTPAGDGLRVFAFGRGADGTAYGRLDAALRLDVPPDGDTAAVSVDVLLTTRVFDVGLMAVIGPGMEDLMQQIGTEVMPGADGTPADIRFSDSPQGAAT